MWGGVSTVGESVEVNSPLLAHFRHFKQGFEVI